LLQESVYTVSVPISFHCCIVDFASRVGLQLKDGSLGIQAYIGTPARQSPR